MNEHKIISRVEHIKYIESKVRRYNKRFQADRWLLEVRTRVRKGFKVAIVSIASDTMIEH